MNLKDAQQLALTLMNEHGLTAQGWTFEFDRAKRRYGQCNYNKRVISLSDVLTHRETNDSRVKNTILHEIAHALVGPFHGHNHVWRTRARAIGCTAERCSSGGARLERPYIGTCPVCKISVQRFRRQKLYHSACGPGAWLVWTKA